MGFIFSFFSDASEDSYRIMGMSNKKNGLLKGGQGAQWSLLVILDQLGWMIQCGTWEQDATLDIAELP